MRTLFGNYVIADWEKHKDIPRIDVKNLYPKTFDVQTYNPHLHKNPIFEQFKRDVEEKIMRLNIEEITLECSHNEMPKYKFNGWCTENPLFTTSIPKSVFKKMPVRSNLPKIKDVRFNGPATIIFWDDDTKTIVKAQNEEFDPEKGIAMAIARKALGNKHDYFNVIERYSKKYWKKHAKEKETIEIAFDGKTFADAILDAFKGENK